MTTTRPSSPLHKLATTEWTASMESIPELPTPPSSPVVDPYARPRIFGHHFFPPLSTTGAPLNPSDLVLYDSATGFSHLMADRATEEIDFGTVVVSVGRQLPAKGTVMKHMAFYGPSSPLNRSVASHINQPLSDREAMLKATLCTLRDTLHNLTDVPHVTRVVVVLKSDTVVKSLDRLGDEMTLKLRFVMDVMGEAGLEVVYWVLEG
ncbi:hypothetical protein DFS34DRAFT_634078 [Phlyctochytrium arcticum]|nr:hypothetical protein DFS34DRAFT_634078 [Phlyctochytrium arcticum]